MKKTDLVNFSFFRLVWLGGKKNDNELRGKETECVNGEEGNVE